MELKIINKKEEPLLSRTRVEAEIVFENATPSGAEIKAQLSKDVGKDEKLVVVKGIYTSYGLKTAKNVSYVYENEDSLKRVEVQKKEKPGKKEAEPEAAAEKPEAKKEEPKEAKQDQKGAKGEKSNEQ